MKIFFISDTHFGHSNILQFKNYLDQPLRPFKDIGEMHAHMISQWNSVVNVDDRVYHLGDVASNDYGLTILPRLNGIKRLVLGNHDRYSMSIYQKYFSKIYGCKYLVQEGGARLFLSHVPIHPSNLKEGFVNVHGHIHNNRPPGFHGPGYFNVSCEVLDYRPIEIGELWKLASRGL